MSSLQHSSCPPPSGLCVAVFCSHGSNADFTYLRVSLQTQTPIMYAYRIFNCQEYYEDPAHPPYEGSGDACALTAVETSTAKDISIMVIISTVRPYPQSNFRPHMMHGMAIVRRDDEPPLHDMADPTLGPADGNCAADILARDPEPHADLCQCVRSPVPIRNIDVQCDCTGQRL